MKKYIVLAGNIGAGKSTLVGAISDKLNWKPYYEPVSENPYLEDFYADMERWAFHSQMYFLTDRLKTHKSLQTYGGSVVQDRSVYEDAEIFARNLYNQRSFTEKDFTTYWEMYKVMTSFLEPPDLVVYLRAPLATLKKRITLRGREFEADIPDTYLSDLNVLYEEWIESFDMAPKLILNADEIDIVRNPVDLDFIIPRIKEALRGGQTELFEE
ncbi:MAG: deoxynucleoside kinase [Spirochaetales bacterium]|nr:deoxynucleoside kinase [Spirochaetales bacterium]